MILRENATIYGLTRPSKTKPFLKYKNVLHIYGTASGRKHINKDSFLFHFAFSFSLFIRARGGRAKGRSFMFLRIALLIPEMLSRMFAPFRTINFVKRTRTHLKCNRN